MSSTTTKAPKRAPQSPLKDSRSNKRPDLRKKLSLLAKGHQLPEAHDSASKRHEDESRKQRMWSPAASDDGSTTGRSTWSDYNDFGGHSSGLSSWAQKLLNAREPVLVRVVVGQQRKTYEWDFALVYRTSRTMKEELRELGVQSSFELDYSDCKVEHFEVINTWIDDYDPPVQEYLRHCSLEFTIELDVPISKLALQHIQTKLIKAIMRRLRDMSRQPDLRDVLNQLLLVSKGYHNGDLLSFYKDYTLFQVHAQPRAFQLIYENDEAFYQSVGSIRSMRTRSGYFKAELKTAIRDSQKKASHWGYNRYEDPLLDKSCSYHSHSGPESEVECSDNENYGRDEESDFEEVDKRVWPRQSSFEPVSGVLGC